MADIRRLSGFNPRARVGRDTLASRSRMDRAEFQSTRPRGARPHCTDGYSSRVNGFNPRARAGRDVQAS